MIAGKYSIPLFPGELRKNDALFMYGSAVQGISVFAYEQHDTEIVHGPSCNKEKEIHIDKCKEDGVFVYERRSGGGTVVLTSGVIPAGWNRKNGIENPLQIFSSIHAALLSVLHKYGIKNICEKGISDLAIDNRKVLGSSLYMRKIPSFFYYQSSLLVNADLELMDLYLQHPPREPQYRDRRGHQSFCTTLFKEGYTFSVAELRELFDQELRGEITRKFMYV
jgi:lipoate-protein ligase A